jgi:hypothetical protein
VLISKETLFAKRPPSLKSLYQEITAVVTSLGEYREETVLPDVIFFKTRSTFLAVKVKKDHLDIEFFLDHRDSDPVISKYLQTSKNRVAHVVPVDCASDINDRLKNWIRSSYKLITTA